MVVKMKIEIVVRPEQLVEIRHDGVLVCLVIEEANNGHLGVIRIKDDPLITHGYRIKAGAKPHKINVTEID